MSPLILLVLATIAAYAFWTSPRALILALVPFFVVQDALVALAGGRNTILGSALQNADEMLAIVLVGGTLMRRVTGAELRWRTWMTWYLGFTLAAGTSVVTANSGWLRGAIGLLLLSKGFAFAFAADHVEWNDTDATVWINLLTYTAAFVALFAVVDLLNPIGFRSAIGFDTSVDFRGGLPSVVSLLGHPGGYGWLMSVGVMISLARLVSGRGRCAGAAVIVFSVASLLSMRRKPLIGVVVAMLALGATTWRTIDRRLVWTAAALVGAVAIPIAIIVSPIIAEGARGYVSIDALTTQARTALYAGAALLAKEHFPLGAGLGKWGSFGSVVDYSDLYYEFGFNLIYGMSPTFPDFIQDTFWPQILGEAGVAGLVGFTGAIIASIVPAWAASIKTPYTDDIRVLLFAAVMIALETLLESFAAPTYTVTPQAVLSIGLPIVAHRLLARRSALDAATTTLRGECSR